MLAYDTSSDAAALFEERRAFLLGLAYRILGTLSEAEDAVQDTYLKWREADRDAIDNPAAWLTTVCTRRCLDVLKSAQAKRTDYIGPWLPEPVHMETPESTLELSSSLSTAFLLLLERLSPKERVAYLLYEIFDQAYSEIAATLGIQETACRKLVSRARAHIGKSDMRYSVSRERQERLLEAFQRAVTTGATGGLEAMLSEDIELCSDGGGKVVAIRRPQRGKTKVLGTITRGLHQWWHGYEWQPVDISGGRGVLILEAGKIIAAVTFAYDEEQRLSNIYVMRNPEKLAYLCPS